MKVTPKGDYTNYKDNVATPRNDAVWARVLDKRYAMEVHRIAPYEGKYIIFDIENDFEVIHVNDTVINYDALFGPDHFQSQEWSEYGLNIVDGLNAKNE
jgi:hypothetical protein